MSLSGKRVARQLDAIGARRGLTTLNEKPKLWAVALRLHFTPRKSVILNSRGRQHSSEESVAFAWLGDVFWGINRGK